MSHEATKWAWKQRVGNPTRKAILVALADHANSHNMCWPGHEGIAERVEVSRRQVIRQIEQLEEDGFLTVERRKGRDGTQTTNRYKLLVTECLADRGWVTPMTPGETENRVTPVTPGPSDTHDTGRVSPVTAPSDTGDQNRVTPMSHEPPIEPSILQPSLEPERVRVAGREVTDQETEAARILIAAFATEAQQVFTLEGWLPQVVKCLRAHSELTQADHLALLTAAFRHPWWDGSPTPAVLYGSVAQFERQLAEWRSGNRPTRKNDPAPGMTQAEQRYQQIQQRRAKEAA